MPVHTVRESLEGLALIITAFGGITALSFYVDGLRARTQLVEEKAAIRPAEHLHI